MRDPSMLCMAPRFPFLLLALCSFVACSDGSREPVTPGEVLLDSIVATQSLSGALADDGRSEAPSAVTGDYDAGFGGAKGPMYRQFFSFSLTTLATAKEVTSAMLQTRQCFVAGTPFAKYGPVVVDLVDYGQNLQRSAYGAPPLIPEIGTLSEGAALGARSLDVTASVADLVRKGRHNAQFRLRFRPVSSLGDGTNDWVTFGEESVSACPAIGSRAAVLVVRSGR